MTNKEVSSKDIAKIVLDFLQASNRPFSSGDVYNNLQNKVASKTLVVKALDNLTASGDINERVNGKQKFYFAKQEGQVNPEEIREMNLEAEKNDDIIAKLKQSNVAKERQIKLLKEYIPLKNLQEEHSDLVYQIKDLKSKLDKINSKCNEIDPNEMVVMKRKYAKLVREWRKRKQMANSVISQLLENDHNKSKKDFMESLGIETDEDVGVTIPNI